MIQLAMEGKGREVGTFQKKSSSTDHGEYSRRRVSLLTTSYAMSIKGWDKDKLKTV